MKSESRVSHQLLRAVPALLVTLAYAGGVYAQEDAPVITVNPCGATPFRTFTQAEDTDPDPNWEPWIESNPAALWSATGTGGSPCSGSGTTFTCAGLTVTLPSTQTNTTEPTPFADAPGAPAATSQTLQVTVQEGANSCPQTFTFKATLAGGGWGDPHLTTVDGIHYDFQSAGEFTALREDGFEVQTRQSPVPTASVPITNEYTGITHCVAVYTAAAVKLGSSRVTVQPSPGAEPDPKSMQVRVNGKVVWLGSKPYVVYAGGTRKGAIEGTIIKHPDSVFEITDAHGTQVVVTSRYWEARKVWYLNVNVYGTSARKGTMGRLAEGSWLPALPDGSSLGAKPESEAERYQVLYEKFADAWRVTKDTSLFDYADYGPGVGTETYTLDEWPRNSPRSCAIEGQEPAQGATEQAAQQACANVIDPTQKADCVFDVKVTGNEDFAKSYEVMQSFMPRPPGWYSPVPPEKCPDCPKCKECPTQQHSERPWWCCWPVIAVGILQLLLLVFLVIRVLKNR